MVPVFNRGVSTARVSTAVLIYLGSIGLVAGVTAGLFFGSGFLLLGQSSERMDAASLVYDRDREVNPLRRGGSSASAEDGTRFGGLLSVLSSTANGTALIALTQTASSDEAESSWKATLPQPPLAGGSDPFPASHTRSHPMLGKARMAAGRIQSTKPDGKQDPEESLADSANHREYNQLHAVGSAVYFAADAVEPLTPR